MLRDNCFHSSFVLLVLCLVFVITSCSDGSDRNDFAGVGSSTRSSSCNGSCANSTTFLSAADVGEIISQAVAEASARGANATIAVVDRVGNVLAVFQMTSAAADVTVTSNGGIVGGLEGADIVPSTLAAISKAITGAYLSTEGNAFSSRTANQIVQETFNPGELNQSSGPLFGVQFSQLPCSDLTQRYSAVGNNSGPKRAPLGLSADPGGFPLYIAGTPVGGIGVVADGEYGIDKDVTNFDNNLDELIALAGMFGYAPHPERRANRITVLGKTLRFSDVDYGDLASNPASAPTFASIDGVAGNLVNVTDYYDAGTLLAGSAFGEADSGIRPSTGFTGQDAFVLVDDVDTERYPVTAAADSPGGNAANALTAPEITSILSNALSIANAARAQIRKPLGSAARVTISVVDSEGTVLGIVRTRDAPIFGIDVSLQKARTATFFSRTGETSSPADALRALPDPTYADYSVFPPVALGSPTPTFDNYVSSLQTFLGVPLALEDTGTAVAFSDRAGGNLSRPHFPDGPSDRPPGPLSKPGGQWSVFSTGLQSDLVYNAILHHVGYIRGDLAIGADVSQNCTGNTGLGGFSTDPSAIAGLANGIQIFPGSVPIYRGSVLVGGIGVSGDGVDQDDMISFLGVHRASQTTAVNNAPASIRADNLTPQGVRLRYISCPYAPFNGSDEQNVCNGL